MDSARGALPDDIEALRAALIAEKVRAAQAEAELAVARAKASDDQALIAHQQLQIKKLTRELYGPRSERTSRLLDQIELQFEELESSATEDEIAAEKAAAKTTNVMAFTRKRPARKPFPEHLPRERVVVPGPTTCPFLFAALGLPAFQHFIPGRIDHHNVQIALAVLLVAAAIWSDRLRSAATAAGILTGAAMAIGFEGAPYVVLAGAAMALRFICDPDGASPLRRYGLSAAASVAVAFLISAGPAHWGGTACDAIAMNSAAAMVVATLGLALAAARLAPAGWPARAGGVFGCGLAATAVFLALEPACLAGPFAMMDPMVRSIWFSQVSEKQPLPTVAATSAPMAAAVASFPAVGVLCAFALARDRKMRGDFGYMVAAGALVVAVAVMVAMVRAYSYAVWLAIPMAAAAALRLGSALRLATLAGRTLVALMLTPTVTSAVALAAVGAMTRQDVGPENSRVTEGCLRSANYAGLAKLPPGLVATDIDYGPYVLALTPHSVMSAPYHRLVKPIIAAHQIFALPPDAAVNVVAEVGADYLVTCGPHALGGLEATERAASLWGRLAAGDVPDWLERIDTDGSPLAIYRVKHQKYEAD